MGKKYTKYINAVLFLISACCIFMNVFTGIGDEITSSMIMQIGLGMTEADELSYLFYYYAQSYFEKMAMAIAFATLFSVLTAIELFVQKKEKLAHISAMLAAIINIGCVGYLYLELNDVISELDGFYTAFGQDDVFGMNLITFALWIGVNIIIIVLSVKSISSKSNNVKKEEAFIISEPIPAPKNPIKGYNRQNSKVTDMPKKSQNQQQRGAAMANFHGVIVGKNGMYRGMAYPLEEKREVYIKAENKLLEISEFKETEAIAGIYYISEYQEYCVEVKERTAVFLMSGQPLGAGRKYYLPRGTEIYIKDKRNVFELA